MAKLNFDYNEVADRVRGFNEQYPQGRIVTYPTEMMGGEYITVRAEVFKTAEAVSPDATGLSWLKVPGSTNFTRGSEIENAETSAVGRALAFIGFYAKGESLASKQEIASKKGDSSSPAVQKRTVTENETPADKAEAAVVGQTGLTDGQRKKLFGALKSAGVTGDQRKALVWLSVQKHSVKDMTTADLDKVLEILDAPKEAHPEVWENVELVSAE